jgi:ABC-type transport system involved in cytochrome c biogenesis permease subunit
MFERLSITCFFASYSVALLLELSRLIFRSGLRGAVMLGFAAAGLLAHTLFLVNRAGQAGGPPLSSESDWYLVAAWGLAATYLYLTLYHPRVSIGVFLLPIVMAIVLVARYAADPTPYPQTQASRVWGLIHGSALVLGAIAVSVGFVAGVMYLLQASRLKRKQLAPRGLRLPSLEWLARANAQAIAVSVLALTVGFAAGVVLNLVNEAAGVDELPWSDPVVLSSGVLLAWVVAVAVFSRVYQPAREGRKVAYLTLATFVFLVLCLALVILLPSQHGVERADDESRGGPRRATEGSAVLAWRGPAP